jgi:hypothetical protein
VRVRRVERVPGVVGAPTDWSGVRVPPVVVVPAGALYIVPGVVPIGVAVPPGMVFVPVVPTWPGSVVPTWPGCMVPVVGTPAALGAPGAPMVPVPGTVVWAKAELLTPSPSRAAKNNWEVFIMRVNEDERCH